jgi:predicted RNA-binding protein YlxR (DUF448 family)
MENLYGEIDLTLLGQIVRQHPEAVRKVTFKNGTTHQFLSINVNARQQTDQYGRTHFIKAGIKKVEQKQDVNYFIADLKPSNSQQQTQQQQSGAQAFADLPKVESELPF